VAGQTIPNLVTVGLSSSGTFDAENLNGSVDVIVDLEGYYASGSPGVGLYNALATPVRICDTRTTATGTAARCIGQEPAPGGSMAVQVNGLGGRTFEQGRGRGPQRHRRGPQRSGHLTVYPTGSTAPLASNVNFSAGEVVPNRVIVPVGGGAVDILSSAGTPDILVDVAGWFTDDSNASATGAEFTPAVTPMRVCDTRSGLSYSTPCAGDTLKTGSRNSRRDGRRHRRHSQRESPQWF
jgi:hypothetical protein